jgi:SAM-dependent methyltransferase
MTAYDHKKYWQERLPEPTIGHESWPQWSPEYLERFYDEQVKRLVSLLEKNRIDLNDKSILEFGPGRGYLIDRVSRKYTNNITGIDLSGERVRYLSQTFPDFRFLNEDISDSSLPGRMGEKFDVLFAMDVLLHLTDDELYANAVGNIGRFLVHNGHAILAEPLILDRSFHVFTPSSNSKVRSINWFRDLCSRHDLDVIEVKPRYLITSGPVDFRTKIEYLMVNRVYFRLLSKMITHSGRSGDTLFDILNLLDKTLTRFTDLNYGSKFVVLRKR